MKNRLFLLVAFIASVVSAVAQMPKSRVYPTGVYIFCGNELPKKFSYIIERKIPSDSGWSTVAELNGLTGEADARGRLMSLPPSMAAFTKIEAGQLARLWERYRSNLLLDSLYAYAPDPRYQFAAGCAWFDEGLKQPGVYQYRVGKKDKKDSLVWLKEERVGFPAKSYAGTLSSLRFKPEEQAVIIHYAMSDTMNTAGVRLYRSKQLEHNYVEVECNTLFSRVNNAMTAVVTDPTAVQGIGYSYVAVPYDALGNQGLPGDTLVVYNLSKSSDIGVTEAFNVKPSEEKRGMELSWKLKTGVNISSIEVYRSARYDGQYQKIAGLSPTQTVYFDNNDLVPATSYYYYIVANAAYGRSFPGPRVPGILKGSKANIIPPQHFDVVRKGNVVTLSFTKPGADIRGYYVYRGNSYTGALRQLPRMLLSADSLVVYNDTIPFSHAPQVYSYAVAGINTSYNISPPTDRISIQTSGEVSVPTGVTALLRNNTVFITWKNSARTNEAIVGYKIYRSAVDGSGKQMEAITVIASVPYRENSYTDSMPNDGMRYRYQVQSIGMEAGDTSSLSRWAGVTIPLQLPLSPGRVFAYAANKKAVIKWDMPSDNSVVKTRIYRAQAGQAPQLVKELGSSEHLFEDSSIDTNKTYYYILTTVNKKNRESKPTDAVAVKTTE